MKLTKNIKVTIEKSKGLSQLEAEALLLKALTSDTHREEFQEPANETVYQIASKIHEKLLQDSIGEIYKILDEKE